MGRSPDFAERNRETFPFFQSDLWKFKAGHFGSGVTTSYPSARARASCNASSSLPNLPLSIASRIKRPLVGADIYFHLWGAPRTNFVLKLDTLAPGHFGNNVSRDFRSPYGFNEPGIRNVRVFRDEWHA